MGHQPLPVTPHPGRNGCQRRQHSVSLPLGTAEPLSVEYLPQEADFLMKIPWCFSQRWENKTPIQQESQKCGSWGNKLLMIFKLLLVSSCFNPSMQNISIITELLRAPQSWQLHLSLDSTIWKFDLTHQVVEGWYCWWLKSCTTWDVWNPINNGINYHINRCRISAINSRRVSRIVSPQISNETLQPPYLHPQDLSSISLAFFHSSPLPCFFVVPPKKTSPKPQISIHFLDPKDWADRTIGNGIFWIDLKSFDQTTRQTHQQAQRCSSTNLATIGWIWWMLGDGDSLPGEWG